VRQADKALRFARRNGRRCPARDAGRVGAGGPKAGAVEKVTVSLVAAGFREWEEPEEPKGGKTDALFPFKIRQPKPRC
jgi:hypothetical protein